MSRNDDPMRHAAEHLGHLAALWCDVNGSKNFAEYVESMRGNLPAGATNLKMQKKPFAASFDLTGKRATLRARRSGNVVYSEKPLTPTKPAKEGR